MLNACPHCDAPLRPGEAYLGWCGECGLNLFRMPAGAPPRPEDEAPPEPPLVPEEWRWVARGILFKLAGLLIGVGAALTIASQAGWDWRRALDNPLPLGVAFLVSAVVLDVVGRMLCLGTPQGATKWLIVVSVVCQLAALMSWAGYQLAAPDAEERTGMLVMAVLGQTAAATTFTVYMLSVGVYFRSPPVMALAAAIKVALAGAYGVVVFFLFVLLLIVVLFVVGVLLMFVCPCVGCLVVNWAGQMGQALAGPFAYSLVIVLVLVEVVYGATLTALLVELWRRRWQGSGASIG
jgi:hypothetical protein